MVSSHTKTVWQMSAIEHLIPWILDAIRIAAPHKLEGLLPWDIQSLFILWTSLIAVVQIYLDFYGKSNIVQYLWMNNPGSINGNSCSNPKNLANLR